MPISINGTGTITGISAGGLPDDCITTADIAGSAVTTAKLAQPMTLATAQASTSGTAIDFTGIPSWVKRVTVMFVGVSTNGTSPITVRLGTSGGYMSSGYLGAATTVVAGAVTTNFTTGFEECSAGGASSAAIRHGSYSINMLSSTTFTCVGILNYSNENRGNFISGSLAISGTLNSIRITTVNGTDTFDAGSINIMYEG